ncbi:UNVERIFIED_CONTAM: hypothetical protein PYX00_006675 [Menopon gallinae]|uniref:Anaphase-promoting complex subunit 4-like WD40 domain-containing protein n=1 Tax=Menopon gallinae TaxID=328185 RepID=A0AAW2HY06_9NEOP
MPRCDTPPQSPAEFNDDMDDIPFDEGDVVEVVEDDSLEPEGDEDLEEVEEGTEEEEETPEQSEIVPERDDAKFVFSKHTDGVLCCAFHPNKNNIAATGGIDDIAHMWDITTGDVLMTTKSHEDSVEVVGFSYDGKYLASSDLRGNIWIWNTNDHSLVREFELGDELSWSLWHHGSNVLISSSYSGLIYMFKILTGEMKMIMAPFGSTCSCGKVFPDGKRLASGYSQGNLKILDMKQGKAIHSISLSDSECGVSCIDVHRDNNLLICGCDNGDVILVNSQAGKVVAVLNSSRASSICNYIETIGFCKDPTYQVAASGSLDGNLIIWDIAKQVLRHRTTFSSSVNHLVWHPNQPVLFTSHSDGLIHMYDSKSGNVLREFMGHSKCIYSLALSPDGTTIMTTSEDKTARIFKVDEEKTS